MRTINLKLCTELFLQVKPISLWLCWAKSFKISFNDIVKSANLFRLGKLTELNEFYLHFQIVHMFEQRGYFCLHFSCYLPFLFSSRIFWETHLESCFLSQKLLLNVLILLSVNVMMNRWYKLVKPNILNSLFPFPWTERIPI